jgi:hypothetical protein
VRETYASINTTHSLAQLGYHFAGGPGAPVAGPDMVGPVRAPDDCPRRWAECYSAVEFAHAPEGVDLLITGGTAALWPWLGAQLDRYLNPEGTN